MTELPAIPLPGTRSADDPLFKSPLSEFKREAERTGLPVAVRYLARGETHRLSLGVPGRQD